MKPAQQRLAMRPSASLDALLDTHPHHAFIATVMACRRCMGTLMAQLARRRELDTEATQP